MLAGMPLPSRPVIFVAALACAGLLLARPVAAVSEAAAETDWSSALSALATPGRDAPTPVVETPAPVVAEPDEAAGDVRAVRAVGSAEGTSRGGERPALEAEALLARAAERQLALSETADKVEKEAARLDAEAKKAAAEAERKKRERAKAAGYDIDETDPKKIARQMAENKFGWGGDQWTCIDKLIMQESTWNPRAVNPSSGAYGLVQSLPPEKMASAGPDWRTNPATQLAWGFDYIDERYGTPCQAWSFHQANNWY